MLTASAAGLLAAGMALTGASPAYAATAIDLGSAESFAVLAASKIENVGASIVSGDVGLTGTDYTGFPPGVVTNGTSYITTPEAAAAESGFTAGYLQAASAPTTEDLTGSDLGGRVLAPGVYEDTSTMQLTGNVTLDGSATDVWIFKAGSSLTTGSDARVTLVNGALACNVFWQVTSSATLGSGTDFVGTIMALASVTVGTGSDIEGRVLAGAAVTMNTNDITRPAACARASAPPSATPSTSAPSGGGSGDGSGDDDSDTGGGNGAGGNGAAGAGAGGPGTGEASDAVVPRGNPDTGMRPEPTDRGPVVLAGLAGLVALGAVLSAARALRTPRTH